MTGAYFESSALVKWYANEQHHVAVRALNGAMITSSLALVEVHLSTANAARRALPEYSNFVCFDKKLNQAAAGEQLGLFRIP